MGPGSLTVVGSGIQAVRHFTLEACAAIESADAVLYSVADPITERWIRDRNPHAESLRDCYRPDRKRIDTYYLMIERTMARVRAGKDVCAVYYGHPGVFTFPSHESIRLARAEGFEARMLPGVSAEDCLFADLGVDPAMRGCQSFEATAFLIQERPFDPLAPLILWQIGVIGDAGFHPDRPVRKEGVAVLVRYLRRAYPADHRVTVYEASQYVTYAAYVEQVELERLPEARISGLSTLYVPPVGEPRISSEMLEALGLRLEALAPDTPPVRPRTDRVAAGRSG